MQIDTTDKDSIKKSLQELNNLIDSGALDKMKTSAHISDKNKEILEGLPSKRNKLVQALMDILADELKQNNPKFQSILGELKDINESADKAAAELEKTADRIESAVEIAKSIDKVLQLAAATFA